MRHYSAAPHRKKQAVFIKQHSRKVNVKLSVKTYSVHYELYFICFALKIQITTIIKKRAFARFFML